MPESVIIEIKNENYLRSSSCSGREVLKILNYFSRVESEADRFAR